MPKETVRTDNGGTAVRVGWQADTGVQLASLRNADYEGSDEANGQFVNLDRPQLNRLIRVLRRARDAAYGRDE